MKIKKMEELLATLNKVSGTLDETCMLLHNALILLRDEKSGVESTDLVA